MAELAASQASTVAATQMASAVGAAAPPTPVYVDNGMEDVGQPKHGELQEMDELKARVGSLELRLASVDERATWSYVELQSRQLRESLRQARLLDVPLERGQAERQFAQWAARHRIQVSSIESTQSSQGTALNVLFISVAERIMAGRIARDGGLVLAGATLRLQRAIPAVRRNETMPLKEAMTQLTNLGIACTPWWQERVLVDVTGRVLIYLHWVDGVNADLYISPSVGQGIADKLTQRWRQLREQALESHGLQKDDGNRHVKYSMPLHVKVSCKLLDDATAKDLQAMVDEANGAGQAPSRQNAQQSGKPAPMRPPQGQPARAAPQPQRQSAATHPQGMQPFSGVAPNASIEQGVGTHRTGDIEGQRTQVGPFASVGGVQQRNDVYANFDCEGHAGDADMDDQFGDDYQYDDEPSHLTTAAAGTRKGRPAFGRGTPAFASTAARAMNAPFNASPGAGRGKGRGVGKGKGKGKGSRNFKGERGFGFVDAEGFTPVKGRKR